MARKHSDEDEDWKDIRPGDIDSVFDLDDTALEESPMSEEEMEQFESNDEESEEETADEDIDNSENYESEETSSIGEHVESKNESDYITPDIEIGCLADTVDKIEKAEESKENQEEKEVKTIDDVTKEVHETIDNALKEEEKKEESNKEENKTFAEIIKDKEPENIQEEKKETEEINNEKPKNEIPKMPEIETPSDEEAKKKAAEGDQSYEDFMKDSFKSRVHSYYEKYSEQDLVNYINDYKNSEENSDIIRECYIQEYVKYSQFIDFDNNPIAKQDLWVLVAGVFADIIERQKVSGHIESDILALPKQFNPEVTEDPNILETLEYKRNQNEKYKEYQLDRTIFNISDDEDEENTSIFDDKRTLHRDFYESEFYKIHKEVMTSDRFADMSKVHSEVIINEQTSYIPIIDYSTGIRVICIDTSDTDQFRINPMLIHRKVPFSFKTTKWSKVKLRILYRDNIKNNPIANIHALKKLVAYQYIKDRYKIHLNHNYTIAYTTDPKVVSMFEKGDIDSHQPENSIYYTEKPRTCQIGVIVLDKKSDKDKRTIRRNQIRRDLGKWDSKLSVDDYKIEFVLSAHVVRNDLRLRNPTLPREERYVEYLITEYNEANPVIVHDGFQIIVACIIKEHMLQYDPGTGYSISFEYDRDGLVTPAVVGMLDERDGVVPQLGSKPNSFDVESQFTLPPSRLKLKGYLEFEKGRVDKRHFGAPTITRRYPRELYANYDLSTNDGRNEFIRSRGFEEFIHMKPIIFDVEPYALNMIHSGEMIRNIIKVSPAALADRNSDDTNKLLFKQSEIEYLKSLGSDGAGTFHKAMFSIFDWIIDYLDNKDKN